MHYLDVASDLRNAVLSKACFLCFTKRLLLAMGAPTSSQHGVGVVHQRHKKFQTLWLEPFFSTAKTLNWSCGWIFAEFPQKRAHKLSNACWNSWPGYIMHLFFFLRAILRLWIWAPCWGRNRKDKRGHHEGGRPLEMIFMLTIGMMFFGARIDKMFG